jgi:4-oxalocrotonate tautomerase
MPIVTIQMVEQGVTRDQKMKLCQGVTKLIHDLMDKDPERVYVLINEVPVDNWSAGGDILSVRRAHGFTGICDCGAHD